MDLIKVITGVRRAGKSVLMETIRDELIQKGADGDHIISVNLEDLDFEYIRTATDLNEYIKSRIVDDGKYYMKLGSKDLLTPTSFYESGKKLLRCFYNVRLLPFCVWR